MASAVGGFFYGQTRHFAVDGRQNIGYHERIGGDADETIGNRFDAADAVGAVSPVGRHLREYDGYSF